MLLDTGAEVTIVNTSFVQHLFPGKQLPDHGREVRSLAGTRTALGGPIPLTIELCGLTLNHPVYFCENIRTFLFGYDLISAAVLVIDTDARCVWSKLTASWGVLLILLFPLLSTHRLRLRFPNPLLLTPSLLLRIVICRRVNL